MKKIIIILLVCLSLQSVAQIEMKPDTVLTFVGNSWQFVKIYNSFVVETIPIAKDSVIYTINTIPDKLYESGVIKEYHKQAFDTLFKYTNRAKIDITYARRLILYQQVSKYVYKEVERTPDEKMFYYIRKAKQLNVKNSTFYNYAPIKAILTKDTIQ